MNPRSLFFGSFGAWVYQKKDRKTVSVHHHIKGEDINANCVNCVPYYIADLVRAEKEHSDWPPSVADR